MRNRTLAEIAHWPRTGVEYLLALFSLDKFDQLLEDIVQLTGEVNYIGLGPFKFTETKLQLSQILGLDSYKELTIRTIVPVIAIGGITAGDVTPLMEAGVYGIAVSAAIAKSDNVVEATKEFCKQLEYGTVNYC